MRIALGLEYDGSKFCGWQSQPAGCGVQDHLEQALAQIAGHPVRVVTAGRTDTGVHGLGQVVHFDTDAIRPDSAWVRGVNSFLPGTVAVQWAQQVSDDFHARFGAVERAYRYVLLNQAVRPGLMQGKVGWYHLPLNLEAMQIAADMLLGEHDFSAFRAAECQAKSPVKQMKSISISRQGNYIVFDLCANAFLHHMVRNIVGSLVYVGNGKHTPDWMRSLLVSADRTIAAPTFSPAGLYLVKITYEPKWILPDHPQLPFLLL